MDFIQQGRQLLYFVNHDYASVRACLFDVARVAGKPDERIGRKQVEHMRIDKLVSYKRGLPALARTEQENRFPLQSVT